MITMMMILLLLLLLFPTICMGSDRMDGRYSFSLTTFDPSGKLGQVERAMIASSIGTPIVAIILHGNKNNNNDNDDDKQQEEEEENTTKSTILMASPQILPSPFMADDGTARFAAVAPHISMAHSGISADGRVLIAAAQRLAVEHAYTFQEPIPIELFLEELSLLFQEYTMKPAARPFGATLLIAHIPNNNNNNNNGKPQLFRIDPSGSVLAYNIDTNRNNNNNNNKDYVIINGKSLSGIEGKLEQLIDDIQKTNHNTSGNTKKALAQARLQLSGILHEKLQQSTKTTSTTTKSILNSKEKDANDKIPLTTRIISASMEPTTGLIVSRQ